MILPRWLYFGTAMSSLVLLTYAGTLFAFSVPVSAEIAEANPTLPTSSRAVVLPLNDGRAPDTLARSSDPDLLVTGTSSALPMNSRHPRIGRALLYIPQGANGTVDVGDHTFDIEAFSGGKEGWILKGDGEADAWFSPRAGTLGVVDRTIATSALWALFAAGGFGFIAPLVLVMLTHRGARVATAPVASLFCRECRAQLTAGSEFCTRCGAYLSGDPKP